MKTCQGWLVCAVLSLTGCASPALRSQSPEALDEALETAERLVHDAAELEPATLEAAFTGETERRGWKRRAYFMAVRVAVTGRTVTPPLFDTIVAPGREKTLVRLKRARNLVELQGV